MKIKMSTSSCIASIVLSLTCFKLLLAPAYRSTDFEVHRNWLAITHSLGVDRWYTEDTSEWTLDYPPFFAWFEWALSWPASLFDKKMLEISELPYASSATIWFQRLSVCATDLVFVLALLSYVGIQVSSNTKKKKKNQLTPEQIIVFIVSVLNAGLLIVDHIHFQYNGFLLGVFVLSLSLMNKGHDLLAGITFAILLNLKHIFAYVAPVYFVYLLRHYCFVQGEKKNHRVWCLSNFLKLGTCVILTFLASFGPFIVLKQIPQVLSRLFPFKRGLSHAYWAPNLWALYNAMDKALAIAGKIFMPHRITSNVSMTRGLVGDVRHAVLPVVSPLATMVLTVVAMMPVLVSVWKHPCRQSFTSAVCYAMMCSFMLGWHVHEKAILMVTVPLGLLSCSSNRHSRVYFVLNTVGNFSLMPLLFRPQEEALRFLLVAFHSILSYVLITACTNARTSKLRIAGGLGISTPVFAYLFGLAFVYAFVVAQPIFLPALPFLPLLVVSTYCSLGMMYGWFLLYHVHVFDVERSIDDE